MFLVEIVSARKRIVGALALAWGFGLNAPAQTNPVAHFEASNFTVSTPNLVLDDPNRPVVFNQSAVKQGSEAATFRA